MSFPGHHTWRSRSGVADFTAIVLLSLSFSSSGSTGAKVVVLGAFLAGAIVGLVDRDSASHLNFRAKLDAIGYGFPVRVFFGPQPRALPSQIVAG
jgi:hypothetical protein